MNIFLTRLQQAERVARGGKLRRLFYRPLHYLAFLLGKLAYRRSHKGIPKTARTFFGTSMQVLLPAATDIYLTGAKTHDSEIRLARYMIRHVGGKTWMDVGAHFGYFCQLAAALDGKVFAFEAGAENFRLLRANAAGHPQISITHAAVTDHDGEETFYEFPPLYSEYNALDIVAYEKEAWFDQQQVKRITVPALQLDTFVRTHTCHPHFLKIDVEGAEEKVLTGARQLLADGSPIVIMEYLPHAIAGTHRQAADLLRQRGYEVYHITPDGTLAPVPDIPRYFRDSGLDSDNLVFCKPGG